MDIFELPKLSGDLTFQNKCKVVRDVVCSSEIMVSFWDDDGVDVLWHDSRVRRYLRQNRDISHYRAGAQWIDDYSYEDKLQLEQSRQTLIDLCTSPAYRHIKALSWTPWEYHGSEAVGFVLYTACSIASNIEVVSTEFINNSHNQNWVRTCSKRLGMERYMDRQFVDNKLLPAQYEVYVGRKGYAASVTKRHSGLITTDTKEVSRYFYGGKAPT